MEVKGQSIPLRYLHIDFDDRSLTFGGEGLAVKLSLPRVRIAYQPRRVLLEVLTGDEAPKVEPLPKVEYKPVPRRGIRSALPKE
jgi:hypothetical protein